MSSSRGGVVDEHGIIMSGWERDTVVRGESCGSGGSADGPDSSA